VPLDDGMLARDHRILGADGALHRAADEHRLDPELDRSIAPLHVAIQNFRRHDASLPHFHVMDLNLNSVRPHMKTSLSMRLCWVPRRVFTVMPFVDPRSMSTNPSAFMRISACCPLIAGSPTLICASAAEPMVVRDDSLNVCHADGPLVGRTNPTDCSR